MERNEALGIVREYYPTSGNDLNEALETLIPDLKEREDERIRKVLIHIVKGACDKYGIKYQGKDIISEEKLLTWLEKQGEHIKFLRSIQIGDEVTRNPDGVLVNLSQFKRVAKRGSQNLANSAETCKVEPKFKVGDWITDNNSTFQIVRVENEWYHADDGDKICFDVAHQYYHPWTIEDSKDGDVLLFEGNYNSIVLFQGIGINGEGRINYHCKCNLGDYSFGIQGDVACLGTIEKDAEHYHPATKEQRDLLFQKMKEAGYEWDAEKKELKKVEQKSSIEICPHSIKSKSYLETGYPVEQNPAEWSEDDENIRLRLINHLYGKSHLAKDREDGISWLKSLKSRCTWKPSDEQMTTLDRACKELGFDESILESLYNDLKKLKG